MNHLKISIKKLEFWWELILKDVDLTLNRTDRISIVWPNGSGKTSLMKIIVGEIEEYDGSIDNIGNMTLWYLHQVYSDDEQKTVHEEMRDAFSQLRNIEKTLKELENAMQSDSSEETMIQYTSLLEEFNNKWGYEYENRIHQVANGIGVLELLDKKLVEISWGQRTKVALAKVLLQDPDVLFLDEPTNFIDMQSVEWLESYLNNKWVWGYVIISHDREFLDKTCNKTLEVQPARTPTMYHCDYSRYVSEREKIEKKRIEEWERQQEYIGKQENLINRFRAGSRAGWAKSREKMIDRMEKFEKPYIPKKPHFLFSYAGESSNKIIDFKEAFIGRSDSLFFIQEVTAHVGQRIGIVGDNGVGKSTLIKTVLWQVSLLEGHMSVGKSTEILYYSQMHEELDKNKTIRENFQKHGLLFPDQHLIAILKHYLFEVEDIDKRVSQLSGGQTSKLLFAILGQKESNVLIFDEPTNHLDYDTRESLESALKKYQGTLIFISHDRYFVNKLATHIWFVSEWELSISYGNYEDYRFKLEHNLEMDMSLFDEEAQLNLVLEDKLWEKQFKKVKEKFGKSRKRK